MTDKIKEIINALEIAINYDDKYNNGFPRHIDMNHYVKEAIKMLKQREIKT